MSVEELVGPAPTGWRYATLGEVCTAKGGNIQTGPFGSQLHAADYVPIGIPSIMPQNIGDNRIIEDGIARISVADAQRLSRYLVRKGDIVYSRRGDVERRALIREHEEGWLCGTGCLRVRFGESIDARFATYYLGHPSVRGWVVRHAHGATMPNLNTAILGACPFLVPPIDEQRKIGDVLSALDDKIDLNRRMSETLEAMARALFKSWFVDFEPVRAKIEGRPSKHLQRISKLFPERFVDSDLGEMPEGWLATTLANLADVNPESWSKAAYPSTVDYVDLSTVKWGRIEEVSRLSKSEAPSRAQRVLRPGDTIVGTVRPGNGSFALVHEDGLTGSTGFAVLHPISPEWTEFVYLAATRWENIEALSHLADGGAYPAIRPDVVAATPVVKPTSPVIRAFSDITRPLMRRIWACEAESRTLARLRDALLPKLISGEIRVRSATIPDYSIR